MYVDHHQPTLASFRSTLISIASPLQHAIDFPFRLFALIQSNLSTHQALLNENASLKARQLLLRAQLQKLIALENENANLRALLKSLPENSQKIHRIEVGQLLAVNDGSYSQEVVVNKGSRMGIYVGQPVLDASGIMGQVIGVGLTTSRVLLVTDTRSSVPVENARNGIRAIAIGQGASGQLTLIHVPEIAEIKLGDLWVTSGLGGNYPQGYPVGTINSAHISQGKVFSHIMIKPSANLNRNTQVLFIWPIEKNVFIDIPPEPTVRKVRKKITEEVQ